MPPSEYGKEALETGVVLQPYEIQAVLGVGGFGITYLAKDRNLKQLIALKEYFPNEVARRLPDNRVVVRAEGMKKHFDWGKSRFLLEAQILAQFRHPNIVRVLTLFEANETAYMAMDFEKGRNLAEILDQRRTLEERELKAIVLPLLSGLEELHGQGFIHRDIKPENIVIRDDGTPVLIDFGAARNAMGNRSRALTTLLTPGYSPLEQYYSTADDQGPWTDIYAFGGVLYRAITGEAPCESALRTSSALSGQNDPLTPAATIGLGRYSRQFLQAVDKALSVLEKDRPQTVAQWRDMLLDVEDTRPGDGTPPLENVVKQQPEGMPSSETAHRTTEPFLLYIDEAAQRRMMENARHDERPGGYGHVVVVSDNVEHVRGDCAKLAASGSREFKAFARGRQALRYLRDNQVDVVLCDAGLRDMAGLSFLHYASQHQRLLPVVLTAHAAERGYVLDAISQGAAGFLKRPISEEDMARQFLQLWQITSFYGVEQNRLRQAQVLLRKGKLGEALESYQAAGRMVEEPRDYYESGFCMLLENNFGEAMVAFKRAARIILLAMESSKGQAAVRSAQGQAKKAKVANLFAARMLARLTRLEETKQLFVNIVKSKSHIPNPFNTLGVALRKQNDFSGATYAYRKALEAEPENARVQYNLARVLASSLKHDEALERVLHVLHLDPSLQPARQLYKLITGTSWKDEGAQRASGTGDERPSPGNMQPLLDD